MARRGTITAGKAVVTTREPKTWADKPENGKAAVHAQAGTIDDRQITVPIASEERMAALTGYDGSIMRKLGIALRSRDKAKLGLRKLHEGIRLRMKMDDGKTVVNWSEAVVWLLEQIADA